MQSPRKDKDKQQKKTIEAQELGKEKETERQTGIFTLLNFM